jgi:small subunit ribosomal protein S18
MARNGKVQKKRKPAETKGRVRRGRPKVCLFCSEQIEWVDYKDTTTLRRFLNDRGRIKARGATGTCSQHQRDVAVAIKTARELILLPYVVRTLSADKGERRGGPKRGRPAGAGPGGDGDAAVADAGDAEGASDIDDVDVAEDVDALA